MIGAAICVLLIACANVAALMLARGMVRTRDYALRLALGADRREIAREVIVEVAVLALVGCVAGALIASWAVSVITRATPIEMRWQGFVQPQWSVRVCSHRARRRCWCQSQSLEDFRHGRRAAPIPWGR